MAIRLALVFVTATISVLTSRPMLVQGGQNEPRVIVAKTNSPAATYSARPTNGNQFQTLPENADIYSSDLLVSLPGGTLTSKNGAITVRSLADFNAGSAQPLLETALVLGEGKGFDLDLMLDRGRLEISNTKPASSALARVRFWDQSWKITLDSPGTRIAVEIYGRWPSGTRFRVADANGSRAKAAAPVASLVLVVLQGTASVDVGGVTVSMKAPPGPAELTWDSLTGTRPQPQKRERLPDWGNPDLPATAAAKTIAATVEKFRKLRAANPRKAIETFLASREPTEQRVALVSLGALDDLESLGKSLVSAKTLDEWDFGITVLRHWLGRCKGQDQRYYEFLTTTRGYKPAQAKTILQLLFGFSAEDLARPETYAVLIDYLIHEKPAIRNLAAWHLVRLVPQGKAIAYKPDGTQADAEASFAAWKKLIPSGELPPPAKKE